MDVPNGVKVSALHFSLVGLKLLVVHSFEDSFLVSLSNLSLLLGFLHLNGLKQVIVLYDLLINHGQEISGRGSLEHVEI